MITVLFNLHPLFLPFPTHLPSDNHQFSTVKSPFLALSISLFFLRSFILFLKFHIWVKSYICLSLTDLFHLMLYSLGPSMLQWQNFMFLWLNNILLCVCVCVCVCDGDGGKDHFELNANYFTHIISFKPHNNLAR